MHAIARIQFHMSEAYACIVCGKPGSPVPLPTSGSWTSMESHEGVPVCEEHNPRAHVGQYDVRLAKLVSEALELRRQGERRTPMPPDQALD